MDKNDEDVLTRHLLKLSEIENQFQVLTNKFEEIIAVVALFRPGPMDNIPSFCNRKHGKEDRQDFHHHQEH